MRLVAGVRERLGANYIGVYLQESLATGGFDDASDVDFLIAIERDVPVEAVDRLQAFHQALYEHPSYWSRHLEGSYVPRAALADPPPAQAPVP